MSKDKRNRALLQTAFIWAGQSTCSRLNVGAVFARDGRILVQGYNGAPAGMPHCNHECNCIPNYERSDHHPDCNSLEPCTLAVHAEANGIAYAARWGVELKECQLFCTHQPCLNCAMLIVGAGIKTVFYVHEYRLKEGIELLDRAGVQVLRHSNPNDRIDV